MIRELNTAGGEERFVFKDSLGGEVYGVVERTSARWESGLSDAWVMIRWDHLWPSEDVRTHFARGGRCRS